jgi:hypothetical protein
LQTFNRQSLGEVRGTNRDPWTTSNPQYFLAPT